MACTRLSFGRSWFTLLVAAAFASPASAGCGGTPAAANPGADDAAAAPRAEDDGGSSERVGLPSSYVPYEGGAPVTGHIGADGGTLSRLLFAVVGDTRPATIDDTNGYPTHVVSAIYTDLRTLRPSPPFVISTGDYIFASIHPGHEGSQAAPQFDIYMAARARFPGAFFPAMGNHECTGATRSNCGAGAADGEPVPYLAFLDKMLAPIRKATPYYVVRVVAEDDAWTAKFVFVAANAWSSVQEAWLESALAQPSTYTFVVRHEPASAVDAPGVAPSELVMARHPYTLAIVGHSHTYRHDGAAPREVLIGNGGAPLTSKDYGFAVFSQRADGAIDVDMIHWRSGRADASFGFAVRADGTLVR